jgi:hypothetical protein
VRADGPVFGTVAIQTDGVAPNFGRFNTIPMVGHANWDLAEPITVEATLDPSTLAIAKALGPGCKRHVRIAVQPVHSDGGKLRGWGDVQLPTRRDPAPLRRDRHRRHRRLGV